MRKKKQRKRKRLEKMQAESYEIAVTWWKDRVDLEFLGVDLGECLVYQVLEAINSITRQEMQNNAQAGN